MSLESVFRLSVMVNMIDNLTGPIGRVTSTVQGTTSKIQRLNQGFSDVAKTGLTIATVGEQITAAALGPVEATFETQRALGELASVGVKDFEAIEKAATSFSETWAGTSKAEFIAAAYDIKSGISSLSDEGVAQFTNLAGMTATATKSTSAEMSSLFATGYGIYKNYYDSLSDLEFGEMFSGGISAAVRTFKTKGAEMSQAIQSLGASATSANVPFEEQLSILGMLQATMGGSEAGTKYKAFLKSAANAGDELKISFLDANKNLLSMPQILDKLRGKFGETLDAAEKMELTKAFGTDEAISMIDLLYGKTDDLQGNILKMYDSMSQGTAITLEMANAINTTTPNQYEVLQQKIQNVAETTGNLLLPTINKMLDKGDQIVLKTTEWINKNQELAKVITVVVIALGLILTVGGSTLAIVGGLGIVFSRTAGMVKGLYIGLRGIPSLLMTIRIQSMYAGDALKAGFSTVKSLAISAASGIKSVAISIFNMAKAAVVNGATAIKNMVVGLVGMARQAIVTAATAMPGLIASVWAFTVALLANPITLIIIGIVALIAAIILLWQNWDSVVAWIQGAWNGFVNGIKAGFDWIMNLFSGMPVWLQIAIAAFFPFIGIPLLIIKNWDSIVAFFGNLWSGISNTFVNGIQAIKDFISGVPDWFKESGKKIIETFTEGIKSVINKPKEMIEDGLAKVRELLPFSDAHEGPLSQLTLSGRKVFETITTGMNQTQNLPAEKTEEAFSQVDLSANGDIKKINLKEVFSEKSQSNEITTDKNEGISIDKLVIQADISKIKDLPLLFKLIKELEDLANSNGLTPEEA